MFPEQIDRLTMQTPMLERKSRNDNKSYLQFDIRKYN